MFGTELFGKFVDTLHLLAQSRKTILSIGTGISAAAAETLPYLVQIPGWDAAHTAAFEMKCHMLAAVFTFIGTFLIKCIKDEDVALKTPLPPPPGTHPAEVQNNTVNVTAAAPVKFKPEGD